ncbi:MAG: hypothetical protein R2795_17800 [Saprospiraceae bacterium]
MEKNYQFQFHHQEPDAKDIRQRMDFDALLEQYGEQQTQQKRSARVRYLGYTISAIAAAVALLLLAPGLFTARPLSPEEWFGKQAFVQAPLPTLQETFQQQTIADAYKGGVIDYPSGSRMVIPASAFMNDRGKEVGGAITIHYRELHDYIDFFASGIPMAYDSAGIQRYLTAAAMVEVYAEQNGRRLTMTPGKAIQVELVSRVPVKDYFSLPEYYVYHLDTAARSWQYSSVDMMQFIEDESWTTEGAHSPQYRWQQGMAQLEIAYEQALQELQSDYPIPSAPLMPTQAHGDRPTLELDFLNGDIALDAGSELQASDLDFLHKGTIWEITPESPTVDPRAFSVTWQRVKLRRRNNQQFELTLIHPSNQVTLWVEPVLTGANYQRAVAAYAIAQAAYQAAVDTRENLIAEKRNALQQQFAARKQALQQQLEQEMENRPGSLYRNVINRFIVNDFGVWSCAQPVAAPQTVTGVRYLDNEGNELPNMTAYVVNPSRNTVYRYLASSTAPVGIEPGVDNLVWVVTPQGDIAITRLNQLADGQAQVVLSKVIPAVQTKEELRKLLTF